MLLVPCVERSDGEQPCPQFPSFFGSSYFCHCAELCVLYLNGDLWQALHIEKPVRMALTPTSGGCHHIGGTIPDIDQMHGVLFSRFAPRCSELEEACGAVCAASISAFSRQVVQHDGEIAQSLSFLWHGSFLFSAR